jgi:hypothetical protein
MSYRSDVPSLYTVGCHAARIDATKSAYIAREPRMSLKPWTITRGRPAPGRQQQASDTLDNRSARDRRFLSSNLQHGESPLLSAKRKTLTNG